MKPLPMPIRVAAGLVVTALEEAQELPRKLSELPVTAVSQALQVSMRLQQRVTELAIKGDRALGALRPVPETPAWARFDEDFGDDLPDDFGEDAADAPRNGLSPRARGFDAPNPPKVTPVRLLPSPDDLGAEPDPESDVPAPRPPAEEARLTPATTSVEPRDETADSTGEDTTGGGAGAGDDGDSTGNTAGETGPAGLPDYESWSLPQLRGRFRSLSLEQLRQLLEWETTHQDRPAYVTMLSNRIASVTGR